MGYVETLAASVELLFESLSANPKLKGNKMVLKVS